MRLATSSTRRWKAGTPDRSTGTAKKVRLPCRYSASSTRACSTRLRAFALGPDQAHAPVGGGDLDLVQEPPDLAFGIVRSPHDPGGELRRSGFHAEVSREHLVHTIHVLLPHPNPLPRRERGLY